MKLLYKRIDLKSLLNVFFMRTSSLIGCLSAIAHFRFLVLFSSLRIFEKITTIYTIERLSALIVLSQNFSAVFYELNDSPFGILFTVLRSASITVLLTCFVAVWFRVGGGFSIC